MRNMSQMVGVKRLAQSPRVGQMKVETGDWDMFLMPHNSLNVKKNKKKNTQDETGQQSLITGF